MTIKPNWTASWPSSKNKANPAGGLQLQRTLTRAAALLEDIPEGNDRFNVLNHILVPHHELVEIEKETEELSTMEYDENRPRGEPRLAKELLPKILITDPAVQAIKEAYRTANRGSSCGLAGQSDTENCQTQSECWQQCGIQVDCGERIGENNERDSGIIFQAKEPCKPSIGFL